MESAKAEAVAGEGKAVTSKRFRYGEVQAAARRIAAKREFEKRTPWSETAGRTALQNANVQCGCMTAVN